LQEQHRLHGHRPGRTWCAHRLPSITAGRRRQPGAPAAGAASVTWPSARDVPGEPPPGAPRCAAGRRPGAPAAGAAPVTCHRPGTFLVRSPPPLDHRRPSPATRDTSCRGGTGDMAIGPGAFLVRSPAPLDVQLAGVRRRPKIPSCRSCTGDMATGPGRSWCAHRLPSITAGRRRQPGITSCRGGTGDMATGPGRSWCAHRLPSITAGRRRQPGAPAAGAAPVTWPPARGVPGALTGFPRSPPAVAGNQELPLQGRHR